MTKIIVALLAIPVAIGTVLLMSVLGGTVLWLIWPTALDAFPRLVGEGWVEPRLSWWASVCLVWVFGLLVKSTQTNNNK